MVQIDKKIPDKLFLLILVMQLLVSYLFFPRLIQLSVDTEKKA